MAYINMYVKDFGATTSPSLCGKFFAMPERITQLLSTLLWPINCAIINKKAQLSVFYNLYCVKLRCKYFAQFFDFSFQFFNPFLMTC